MGATDAIDAVVAGELTRAAFSAQSEWLERLRVEERLPERSRVVYTGCGTSFHAAQTAGDAVHALDAVVAPPAADVLVLVSHEGETTITVEAARAFRGETWCVTGAPKSTLARACDRVVVCTPELERSMCHTASYTCAVAALAALRGEDVSWLADAIRETERFAGSRHDRWLVAGAGATWPTAQEAALKLREGAFVVADAHHTEQLLHGHLAAVDETVRAFVFEGPDRIGERARDAVAALRELGCDVTLVPARHPVVDIVPFQRLMLEVAELRGANPDLIRRDEERWARARAAYR
jgi:glucosamine--fructose-6-phosphate aminotransferase (isomerizing)